MNKKIYDILPPKEDLKAHVSLPHIEKERKAKGEERIPFRGFRMGKVLGVAASLLLLLVVVFGAVYLRFLEARVTIWPVEELWEFQQEVRVRANAPGIDEEALIIPGRIIKAEEEIFRQFSSSGKVTKETKAKGIIRVYNNYNQVQVLVAATRFLSAEGKLFRSTQRVTIPPGGETDVEVEAAEPGEAYNIGPATFSIPGLAGTARYTQVYGKSFAKMEGGSGEVRPQVTSEDINGAKEAVNEELAKKGKAKVLDQIQKEQNLVFFEEALSQDITEPETLVKEGAEVDSFQAKGKVTARTLVFTREDLEKFAKSFILKEVGSGKALNEKSLKIHTSPVKMDWEGQELTIAVSGSAKLYQDIDIDELKNKISGQPVSTARAMLGEVKAFERFQIKLWPLPWRSVPKDVNRIKVDLRLTNDGHKS